MYMDYKFKGLMLHYEADGTMMFSYFLLYKSHVLGFLTLDAPHGAK